MCYLEQMKVGDLVYLIMPCLMEDALAKLNTELQLLKGLLPPEILSKRVPMLLELVCKYSRDFWSVSHQGSSGNNSNSKAVAGPKWKYVIREIRQLENLAARTRSLCDKWNVSNPAGEEDDGVDAQLIRELLSGQPTAVSNGPENRNSKEILQMFQPNDSEGDVVRGRIHDSVKCIIFIQQFLYLSTL